MSAGVWVGVALLGGIGTTLRFLLDRSITARARTSLPLGTFLVNVSGSLLLGLLTGLALSGDALILAGSATLGSYTTFSTWMLESQRLAEDAQIPAALLNILLSLAVGVGAAAIGHLIGVNA